MTGAAGSADLEETDPIAAFREGLARARGSEPGDPTVAALATADTAGRPAVRMVLLKQIGENGLVFFTNYESRKARHLAANPWAALCVYWPTIHLQVRAEGTVERVPDAESDAYFATRPRDSQIAAWASRQSAPLRERRELEARVEAVEARFGGGPVSRPPFWGGYRLLPERIELWRGREHRLHDRILYRRSGKGWERERLYP